MQGQVRAPASRTSSTPLRWRISLWNSAWIPPSVVAGLLHDVIEDTPVTYDDIVKAFGRRLQT